MPTDYTLYALAVPEASRSRTGSKAQQNISEMGILQQGQAAAKLLSSNPGQQTLDGYYAGQYAEKMATELEELAQGATAASPAPLAGNQSSTPLDGYYLIESANVEPPSPQERSFWRYQLSLTKEGTRSTHRREVTTTHRELKHPWGNDTTAIVAVPATATDVRWLDPSTDATEAADPVATHAAELGDVDLYDLADGPTDDPSLVYDIAYADEGPLDVRVWDTKDMSKTDSDGVLQWQKCFSASHEFTGEAIIDTGRLRLRADPGADPGLAAETWDGGAWTPLDLGASDWTLQAFDIGERSDQRLGLARVDAWTRWHNPTTGADYPLDVTIHRGWERAQWARVPESDAPVPDSLQTLLAPVASDRLVHPQPVRGLRPREAIN